jgi:23S rRNA (guanosine2251-2'-O)-methyltransferase
MKRSDIIYGYHPVFEALSSGKTIEKVMIQKGLQQENLQKLLGKLKDASVAYQYVPKVKLDSITRKNHQGILAFISPIEYSRLEWLLPSIFERGENPLIVVLDHITDVRNFGAICRSAEGAGAHAVVIPAKGAAQVNEDAVKTSAGALLRIPVCKENNLIDVVKYLKSSGIKVLACHEKAEISYYKTDLSQPTAFVMGSEELGINPVMLQMVDGHVAIPMLGDTESLNVSVATAILLFDALRQRAMEIN